jgi:hypothetical protein
MTTPTASKLAQVRKRGPGLLLLGTLGALAVLLAGCQGGEPRSPDNAPLPDDATDIQVIQRAIRDAGMKPSGGREVQLTNGKSIYVDVAVMGRELGIAYIDQRDAAALGDAIPPYRVDPEKRLRIVRGGADGETRILLLYHQKYDPTTEDRYSPLDPAAGLLATGVILSADAIVNSNRADKRRESTREELSFDVQRFLDYAQAKSFR